MWAESKLPTLQATEMENMANITIQAILASSASRDAQGLRKRKLPDMYEEQSKRHNSLLSEGESYQYVNGQQQVPASGSLQALAKIFPGIVMFCCFV